MSSRTTLTTLTTYTTAVCEGGAGGEGGGEGGESGEGGVGGGEGDESGGESGGESSNVQYLLIFACMKSPAASLLLRGGDEYVSYSCIVSSTLYMRRLQISINCVTSSVPESLKQPSAFSTQQSCLTPESSGSLHPPI